jgi:tetratricopeptide (TPR) repeat protein
MPNAGSTLNNYGLALQRMDRQDEAMALYQRAIAIEPNNLISHGNLGTVYSAKMNLPFARICYEKAIELGKTPISEFNLSMLQLLAGDFKSGWRGYESRWLTPEMKKFQRNFNQPIWLGHEKIEGKKILLHAEQGLGDTLQFVRYIERVAMLGATIYLEVQPELKSIIQSMPHAPFIARIFSKGEQLPPFDLHCPLLSLPLAFRTHETSIPMQRAYIVAPPSRLPVWQERISCEKKKVGLVWSGNENHSNDHNRSIPISAMLPFLVNEECQFYLLQPKIRDRDAPHIPMQCIDLGPMLKDFSDTAAAIAQLDLVITVDTSVAHLAGAMGKPVWILLPRVPDFRWLLEKKTSPWYPSATLFRQPDISDWASVISEVRSQLEIFNPEK